MSDEREEVSLFHEGDRHTLRRKDADGRETEIELTTANLLALRPLIQKTCAQFLEQWGGPTLRGSGTQSIVPITAGGFDVTVDAFHRDEVFLALRDRDGDDYAFALSPSDALRVARRLAEKVRELEQSLKTRQ